MLVKYIFHLSFIIILSGCSNEILNLESIQILENQSLIEQYNTRIKYSDSGLVKIVVVSGHMKDFTEEKETSRQEFSDGFRVGIINKDGLESGHVKSINAIRDLKTQIWTLMGNVEVIHEGGNRLYTDKLYWDRKAKQFHTDSQVRIIDKEEEIIGLGLKAEDDLSEYTIFDVKGHFESQIIQE
ncbi:LPS export ABC transporter periplasmic protein LptC [Schleiferiaceae bacterium]|jgi:LPS export ABC transporter protein LptC|nr:LPS export ABC transporter periplasmic protein LptC [Schleiferiaceae bacterium]